MKNTCSIFDDLLPLYLENSCSQDSAALVEAHLKECPACQKKYDSLKSNGFLSEIQASEPSLQITACAKKVRRHRLRVGLLTVFITFLSACFLFLCFLAAQDMHRQANPTVFPVEEGVHNLTAADLETTAGEVGNHILFTNYTQIQVCVPDGSDFEGQVLLWDAQAPSSPIQYGQISANSDSCIFSGLTSARRYIVTCDGDAQMPLTVSEGRTVSFFHSLWSVLEELIGFALE